VAPLVVPMRREGPQCPSLEKQDLGVGLLPAERRGQPLEDTHPDKVNRDELVSLLDGPRVPPLLGCLPLCRSLSPD
jgi:hypothetical protein